MSAPLDLARELSARDADDLAALLTARDIGGRSLRDLFDLADALLDEGSILAALAPLPRPVIELLASGQRLAAADADGLLSESLLLTRRLSLVDRDGRPFAAVIAVASRVLADAPASDASKDASATIPATPEAPVDADAAERATAAVLGVHELLDTLRGSRVRWRARGGIAVADERRLTADLDPQHADVAQLAQLAIDAGLAAIESDLLLPTDEAASWAALPAPERWSRLIAGWSAALPHPLASVVVARPALLAVASALDEAVRAAYPAVSEAVLQSVPATVAAADALGLIASGRPTSLGAVLAGTEDPESIAASFPSPVEQVYLLDDLSVVSPGPLAPELDARLRDLAAVESRGLATTYRISRASLDRALSAGETEQRMRDLLTRISLTGIPQALDYLLREAAAAHGRLRVESVDGETVIGADDPRLTEQMSVDQSLSALRLEQLDSATLVTSRARDAVYWMLVDAGYAPSAWVDGHEVPLSRARIAHPATSNARDDAAAAAEALQLASRLLAATPPLTDDTTAWNTRELERALRAREQVRLGVRMPDGSRREIVAMPLGLSGGRLRFSDTAAGVERTVPVRSIDDVTAPAADASAPEASTPEAPAADAPTRLIASRTSESPGERPRSS
ncbi:helicase-associated domain-containing protein [Cnuibacter sp. UC19_7]|uniref:helicase-associated domain-containing protein n=1 Tax=Cnuibacter sp. UC19_7 TaxID=3350166 RepID=UPI00366D8354